MWNCPTMRLRSRVQGFLAPLREANIRPDLIRSDGSGMVELFLYDGDTTVDRT